MLSATTITINSDLATRFGVPDAIVLQHLAFWINFNKQRRQTKKDGKYWTYQSIKEIHNRVKCLKEPTIRGALKRLEDKGVIITGHYSRNKRDRSKWYTITDSALFKDIVKWQAGPKQYVNAKAIKTLVTVMVNWLLSFFVSKTSKKPQTHLSSQQKVICESRKSYRPHISLPADSITTDVQRDPKTGYTQTEQDLLDIGLSKAQVNNFSIKFDEQYLKDKLDQFLYMKSYHSNRIRNDIAYLYNSIAKDREERLYTSYLQKQSKRLKERDEIQQIELEEQRTRDYNYFVHSKCEQYFEKLSATEQSQLLEKAKAEVSGIELFEDRPEEQDILIRRHAISNLVDRVGVSTFEEWAKISA